MLFGEPQRLGVAAKHCPTAKHADQVLTFPPHRFSPSWNKVGRKRLSCHPASHRRRCAPRISLHCSACWQISVSYHAPLPLMKFLHLLPIPSSKFAFSASVRAFSVPLFRKPTVSGMSFLVKEMISVCIDTIISISIFVFYEFNLKGLLLECFSNVRQLLIGLAPGKFLPKFGVRGPHVS